jgi:hypothetical protein
MSNKIYIHCPACGFAFSHTKEDKGKNLGGFSGAAAGATLGAKVGITFGPIGAIAGTVPGAVLGFFYGKELGDKFDRPRCPSCGTKFQLPEGF